MSSLSDVTIIVPVYCNTPQSLIWLDECLQSASIQGCSIAVHDDGSPMNPTQVISKYNIASVSEDVNKGVSYARNAAITAAQTQLILPLDCDDRLAPGAVAKMLEYWDGETPVYSDLRRFGMKDDPHFRLLDFDCSLITKHVGFTAVNVLYPKRYWAEIGGYDTTIVFYEDGEFNARLFAAHCGVRCPYPLVEYRIHPTQRTKLFSKQAKAFEFLVLEKTRRLNMACPGCSKRRTANLRNTSPVIPSTSKPAAAIPSAVPDLDSMPLEFGGNVLAIYTGGKGLGRHYYNGIATKQPYRVMHGQALYVNPRDITSDPKCCFTRVVRAEKPAPPPPATPSVPEPAKPGPVEDEGLVDALVRKPVAVPVRKAVK